MEIYLPQKYPKPVLAKLNAMPPLAHEIANRWMRGWPKSVEKLLKAGTYLEFLKNQEETERRVLSDPSLSHLANHEIAELYGLSPKPPMTTD